MILTQLDQMDGFSDAQWRLEPEVGTTFSVETQISGGLPRELSYGGIEWVRACSSKELKEFTV